jgi:hypothetical protein
MTPFLFKVVPHYFVAEHCDCDLQQRPFKVKMYKTGLFPSTSAVFGFWRSFPSFGIQFVGKCVVFRLIFNIPDLDKCWLSY